MALLTVFQWSVSTNHSLLSVGFSKFLPTISFGSFVLLFQFTFIFRRDFNGDGETRDAINSGIFRDVNVINFAGRFNASFHRETRKIALFFYIDIVNYR